MATKVKQRNQVLKGKHGGMQLVLTEDVAKSSASRLTSGRVKAGYGRRYLLPRPYGNPADGAQPPSAGSIQDPRQAGSEARIADLENALSEQISKMPFVTVEANANEEGLTSMDRWLRRKFPKPYCVRACRSTARWSSSKGRSRKSACGR